MSALRVVPFLIVLVPFFASAHEIKIDGPMSVLLHMEPQDSPVVGEPARLFLAFTDSEERFALASCVCGVAVRRGDETLFVTKLDREEPEYGSNVASANITFPERGIYEVVVSGKPVTGGAFTPFSIQYAVRIERTDVRQDPVSPVVTAAAHGRIWIYAGGALLAGAILILGFRTSNGRKKSIQ